MSIWKKSLTIEQLNSTRQNTLVETLGIMIIEIGDDFLTASMPVDHRTHQPMGIMHGGASVSLAETVGSIASFMAVDDEHYCVGLDINANHIRAVRSGLVTAIARPLHRGKSTHVWEIKITDESARLVSAARLTMAVLKRDKQ